MKKIILNEQQEQFLIKEFMQQGFNFEKLDSLESCEEKIEYCTHYLGEYIEVIENE